MTVIEPPQSFTIPGPSSEPTSSTRASVPSTPPSSSLKRRRQEKDTASPIRIARKDVPKKKKAARACIHCQRAHLTCDDARPCQRCTKRGMADSCVEGHRKRAKYLLGETELELLKKQKTGSANSKSPPAQVQPPTPKIPAVMDGFTAKNSLSNTPLITPSFTFGSEAANLEYSILTAILGNPSPESNPTSDSHSSASPPPSVHPFSTSSSEYLASWTGAPGNSLLPSEPNGYLPSPLVTPGSGSPSSSDFLSQTFTSIDPDSSATSSSAHIPQDSFTTPVLQASSVMSPSQSALNPLALRWPLSSAESAGLEFSGPKTAEEVYQSITKPYDYTEGYHFLMKVLPFRFEKNEILRIVRALAIFRPSMIALQMPFSEEDEIFVEKCVQRSVIELNRLISYSGTPTVVWRRTGEICLVGPEFSMLTHWSKEELLGTKKYIWELFENQSAVEYWENFATHAFENTAQSVYSHCVLLKPDGTPVPTTFCFHIRRDLFDLPSLVIGVSFWLLFLHERDADPLTGQWLPLL
ncbi:hypothetical protein F5888DRAFT_1898560 [Russula emetica]|nr:hypothetical protein F5888DRAFT_1898560 [Russula emetica]